MFAFAMHARNLKSVTNTRLLTAHFELECVRAYLCGDLLKTEDEAPFLKRLPSSTVRAQHLLMSGGDPNQRTISGYTPLHLSASRGSARCVHALLEYGADITALDRHGKTPLRTAKLGSHTEASRMLRSAGQTYAQPADLSVRAKLCQTL